MKRRLTGSSRILILIVRGMPLFLKELLDHLRGLRQPWGDGGTSGQPTKFSNIEVQELIRWISEKRGN